MSDNRTKEQVSIGNATLYLGDCREILPSLQAVDALISDPPYGLAPSRDSRGISHGQRFMNAEQIAGDESTELADFARAWAKERGVTCCMFFSPYRYMSGWRSVLTWSKGAHVGIGGDRATCWKRDFELIGVEGNGPLRGQRDSAVLHFSALLPPPTGHFAEKPVPLMEYLVNKISADVIVDPFMGSGTTGLACLNLGRKFIGIEIDRKYFDIACDRISHAHKQQRLFA